MGIGRQIHHCLQNDCEATFEATWEESTDDWSKGHVESIKQGGELGWQAVSLPGKLRFYCPVHHHDDAPTR